jgi:cation diffusion facilitator family transporter
MHRHDDAGTTDEQEAGLGSRLSASHGHNDAHAGGILGWLRHTFGHSHTIQLKMDNVMQTSERGIWALKVSFAGLGLTALFQLIIVFASGSAGLLADTIHNFGDAATSVPLWVAFALVRRGQTRKFPYGYGRVEDIAGVIIVLVIFFSACVAGYESIKKLIDPQPIDHLWWVAVAALIGFIGNELIAMLRIRVGKEIGSAALVADGQHARVDGFTSLAVLIGAIGVATGAPILDPLVGLGITVAILFIVKDAARAVFRRMLDSIEPEMLNDIEHVSRRVEGVQGVHAVRARWVGHRVQADLHITVDRTLSVDDSHAILQRVEQALADEIPAFGGATIHVDPCAHPEPATDHSSATA